MNIIVSGKKYKISEALRDFATEKAGAIQRYFDHIIEADVTLSLDKAKVAGGTCRADVTVWANGRVMRASDNGQDMLVAINGAVGKIESQLRKYKSKLRERPKRRGAALAEQAAQAEELPEAEGGWAEPPAERPRIIRTRGFAVKPMSIDEAADQLHAMKREFIVFSNSDTNEVNVVYRRPDGNVGLIEPTGR